MIFAQLDFTNMRNLWPDQEPIGEVRVTVSRRNITYLQGVGALPWESVNRLGLNLFSVLVASPRYPSVNIREQLFAMTVKNYEMRIKVGGTRSGVSNSKASCSPPSHET